MESPLATAAVEVARRIQAAGFIAYWVGGCVRDHVLGRPPKDFDIVTNALPGQLEGLFPRTTAVGRQFGVLLVREGAYEFEVATFRAESGYTDGRHPDEVRFGDAAADARRRDFTINGLFYDPVAGTLHDEVGGRADLERGLIRAIGDPAERFREDHLRLLRGVRLAAQLGFAIAPATLEAMQRGAALITRVSAERIRDELVKTFQPPFAARGLDLLRESGLLAQVLPEIAATEDCAQDARYHPEGSVYQHLRLMLTQLPQPCPPLLPWAVLLHDVGKPPTATQDPATGQLHFYTHEKVGATMAEEILRRLRFSNQDLEIVVACVLHHMQFKDARAMKKSSLRRLLLRPTFELELALHRLDCLGSHQDLGIYDFLVEAQRELAQRPEIRPPLLSGHDLMALGIPAGPQLGHWLAEIRERQLADELKDAAQARQWLQSQLPPRPLDQSRPNGPGET